MNCNIFHLIYPHQRQLSVNASQNHLVVQPPHDKQQSWMWNNTTTKVSFCTLARYLQSAISYIKPSLRQSVDGFPKCMLQQSSGGEQVPQTSHTNCKVIQRLGIIWPPVHTTSITPAEGCCSTSSCELYKTPQSTVTDINSATVNRDDPRRLPSLTDSQTDVCPVQTAS